MNKLITISASIVAIQLVLALPVNTVYAAAQDYDGMIQESLQLRNAGDFAAAEALLRQAFLIPAETNEVAYLLAMVVAFQERYLEANSILDEALGRYPQDVQLNLAKARVLSFQGDYAQAISITQEILGQQPGNNDARNLLGRVYYYQRRYTPSREAYSTVLASDTNNLEALIGLYDTELAAGNDEEAETLLDRAFRVDPGHIDVMTRQFPETTPVVTRRHEIITSYNYSDLDLSFFDPWYDRSLEYRYHSDSGNQFYLRGEHDHRFGFHDTMMEVGAVFQQLGKRLYEIAVAHTDDNDFLPESRFRLGTTFDLFQASNNFGASTLGLSYMQSKYLSGDVKRFRVDLTHYFLGFNGWITPGVALVEDENGKQKVGWNMGLHWQSSARLLMGYNYTYAPETENSITTRTRANHVYARYQLVDSLSLRLDISQIVRENSYTRDSVALTLQYQY